MDFGPDVNKYISVKVAFVRDKTILSLAIRAFAWSRYHHCGAVTPDGLFVIESSPVNGVVKTPLSEFNKKYSTIHYAELKCDNEKAFEYLESRIGNKYDWLAVFGLAFRFLGENNNKDYCSELIADASGLFRNNRTSRVTPELLWMISK